MNKHHKISILIFFILIHSVGYIFSQTDEYKFKHLTTKDGLSSKWVTSIIKDSNGFMWFGTDNGLNRFDGNNIVVYKNNYIDSSSLSDNYVLSLMELDPDHLLVGTAWGGLNIFDKATEKFVHFKHQNGDNTSLSFDHINVIYRDRQEQIWVGSNDGLNLFHPDSGKFEVFKQVTQHQQDLRNQIRSLFQDSNGNFWIGTGSGLFQFDLKGKLFSPVEFDPSIDFSSVYNVDFDAISIKVNCISEDPFGTLWIGTDMGLLTYDYPAHEYVGSTGVHIKRSIEDIEMISINDDHYAWISTSWGLFQYDFKSDNLTSFYTIPGDPASISIQATGELMYDNTGLLWIVTSGMGIDVLNLFRSPFQQYSIYIRPDPWIFSASTFCEDNEGNFWIGSHGAGLMKYDKNLRLISRIELRFSDNTEWVGGGRVLRILQDAEGLIWIGLANPKPSVSFLNPDNKIFQIITEDTIWPLTWEFPVRYFIDMIEDQRGNKWLGYYSGLSWIPSEDNNNLLVRKVDHNELSTTTIWDLYEDRTGLVWVASRNGLYSIESDKHDSLVFIKYTCFNEDQEVKLRSVFQSTNGKIWVFRMTLSG